MVIHISKVIHITFQVAIYITPMIQIANEQGDQKANDSIKMPYL